MNRKTIIFFFFSGLFFFLVVEVMLVRIIHHVVGLPVLELGIMNVVLGVLGVAAGAFMVIWSVWAQYTEGHGTPAPMAATKYLITGRPYAYTRNPMTLGAALLYLGIAVFFGSGFVLGLVTIIFSALLTYIYIHETQELSERFGQEYLKYKENTPFLIPKYRKGVTVMKSNIYKAAAVLAFVIGGMAVFAGGKVLLGQTPDYYVIDWVPVYNFSAGLVSMILASILLWKNSRYALPLSFAILASHSTVMIILQTVFGEVVAPDSIRAMTIRITAWVIILSLQLVQARQQRTIPAR